uniref:Uncharacterized protein n=1 Tax=Rhizophora mucronata TaxID=61149 RepID=A0A2P2MVK2_RHIMU
MLVNMTAKKTSLTN